jgi:phosphopantothenoylcysteine synthetase/decarboxylase
MKKPTDRDSNYMYQMWGTTKLTSDYGVFEKIKNSKTEDKKHDFEIQNKIHEEIRNDDDYDDWEYGTEPIYSKKWF